MADDLAETLYLALARAEDAVSRLDMRVQTCGFADGWAARIDFLEASAWGWTSGEIVDLEDLVLHDAEMDVRAPDQALRATYGLVRARRLARRAGPEVLTAQGAAWLAGRRAHAPSPGASLAVPSVPTGPTAGGDGPVRDLASEFVHQIRTLSRGETADPDEAVAEWLAWSRNLPGRAPPLLRAAAALEGWRLVNPLPRQAYVGAVLVAQDLRLAGS